MTNFGTLNQAGEVVPFDSGNVYFRHRLSSGERCHASLDFRWQRGDLRFQTT
jgi:hypothetical protein